MSEKTGFNEAIKAGLKEYFAQKMEEMLFKKNIYLCQGYSEEAAMNKAFHDIFDKKEDVR